MSSPRLRLDDPGISDRSCARFALVLRPWKLWYASSSKLSSWMLTAGSFRAPTDACSLKTMWRLGKHKDLPNTTAVLTTSWHLATYDVTYFSSMAFPSEDCLSIEHCNEPVTAGTWARKLQPLSVRVWWKARCVSPFSVSTWLGPWPSGRVLVLDFCRSYTYVKGFFNVTPGYPSW